MVDMGNKKKGDPRYWKCILCGIEDDETKLQRVRSGISSLIYCSEVLEKFELMQHLQSVQDNINEVRIYVHNPCRKQLQNEVRDKELQVQHKTSFETNEVPHKRRHSDGRNKQFNWKEQCFICTKVCDVTGEGWSFCDVKRKDKPESTRDKILELIGSKFDEQSLEIKSRLLNCADLPAVEARYHHVCRKKLDIYSKK